MKPKILGAFVGVFVVVSMIAMNIWFVVDVGRLPFTEGEVLNWFWFGRTLP